MSTTTAVPERSIDLTAARFERAVTQEINVERTAPLTYEVDHESEIYAVDLGSGYCTCLDCQFRGLGCKHAINCALDTVFTDGSQSRFVAQVIAFAREAGCPFNARGCDGPCGIGVYPCPDCVTGIGVGDWKVWTHLIQDTGGEC